jgi:hypothetical protein
LVQYILLPYIFYWFFNFDSTVHLLLYQNADPEEHRFFLFTLSFALLTLQTFKIISYGLLVTRHPFRDAFRRRPRRRHPRLDPDEQPGILAQIPPQPEPIIHPEPERPDPDTNAIIIDPTLEAVAVILSENNNNPFETLDNSPETVDTDNEQHSQQSIPSSDFELGSGMKGNKDKKKKRKKRGKPGKQGRRSSEPLSIRIINSVLEDMFQKAVGNDPSSVSINIPGEPCPGPSRRTITTAPNSHGPMPYGPWRIDEEPTASSSNANNPEEEAQQPPATAVIDWNNNDNDSNNESRIP